MWSKAIFLHADSFFSEVQHVDLVKKQTSNINLFSPWYCWTIAQWVFYTVVVSFIGGRNQRTGENHHHVASHWQTWSHNVVHLALIAIQTHNFNLVVIGTDCIGSCKSNYHTITATAAPLYTGICRYV
jgi:hypothetical protein